MSEEETVRDVVRSVVDEHLPQLPVADIVVRPGFDHYDLKIYRIEIFVEGSPRQIDPERDAAILRDVVARLFDVCGRDEDFGFPILSWNFSADVRKREPEAV
jgi:hypothetical protein